MGRSQNSGPGHTDILFNWYYDEDSGGFYTTPSDKASRSYEPNLFSTIEALWAVFQSPLNDRDHHKVQQTIRYVCDELAEYDDLCPANPELEHFAFDYSVISVSYALLILTRARKYAQRQSIEVEYHNRLEECIRTHLKFVCEAQHEEDGGWGFVPRSYLSPDDPIFSTEVYCTSIALMGIQSCTLDDFDEVGYDAQAAERIVANGLGALIEMVEIPDPVSEDAEISAVGKETFEEATLVATWMLSFTRIIWDRNLWSEHWNDPTQFKNFNDNLNRGSKFLKSVVNYEKRIGADSEFQLVEFSYEHQIAYPYRGTDGRIQKESFVFELPGSAAVPALVLTPVISVWSEECQSLKGDLEEIIENQRNEVVIDNKSSIKIYEFTGKIVSLTYLEAAEQGISKTMRHFIQWGEIPNIVGQDSLGTTNQNGEPSKTTNIDGPLTRFGRASDRLLQDMKKHLLDAFGRLIDSPKHQLVLYSVALGILYTLGATSGWSQNTIYLSLLLAGVPAMVMLVYSVLNQNGLSKVQSGIVAMVPPLVLAGIASLFLVESQTAIVGGTLIIEIIGVSITVLRLMDENNMTD